MPEGELGVILGVLCYWSGELVMKVWVTGRSWR